VLAGVAVVGLIGCAGVAWAGIGTDGGQPRDLPTNSPLQVESVVPTAPTARSTRSIPPAAPHRDWLAILDRLDAVRARAFAARRPALLAHVYAPGPLLADDAASLTRLVPPGCGLRGAHTSFRPAGVVAHGGRAVITASASMAPSRLTCPDRPAQTAKGATARLQIVLRSTPTGVRIVAERVLG
jgi:hypothetical protein